MKEKQIEGFLWKFEDLGANIEEKKEKTNYQHHTGDH
jgi:hypothetical protein